MVEKSKPITELSATEKKALMVEALEKEGYTPYQIAQIMGVSKQFAYRIDKQMRQGILTPLVKKARKAVEQLVEGHKVGDMEEVKGSDVTTAAKMVIDRYEPIVNKIEQRSLSISTTLSVEERERYHKMLGLTPPVLPEHTEEKK